MRKMVGAVLVLGAAFAFTGGAQAAVITDTYVDPAEPELVNNVSYAYQHSLLTWGFIPGSDTINIATLTIDIDGAGGHNLTLEFDGTEEFSGLLTLAEGGVDVTVSYLLDGLLDVVLTKTSGPSASKWYFLSSVLEVDYTAGNGNGEPGNGDPADVPEPAVLGLLGMGLIGLGLVAQRRRRTS